MRKKWYRLLIAGVAFMSALTGFHREAVYAMDDEGNTVIVIDAGHGGDDPGKIGINGIKEEDVNYQIALDMQEELEKYDNVKVYLTRHKSDWLTNAGRAMVGAELNADFLICLHNNSGTDTSEGAIVYTSVLPLYSSMTADMGNYILNNLEELGIKNCGIQTRDSTEYEGEDYYTIMAEAMREGVPAVLVEHCFLSNPQDCLHVSRADGTMDYEKVRNIGIADAKAVVTYFNLQPNVLKVEGETDINLERGYSVKIEATGEHSDKPAIASNNENVVKIDEEGYARAVNSGSSVVTFLYEDGTSGKVNITVNVPRQIALVGAMDPTFYDTWEDFAAIDINSAFANVIYSDGQALKVIPEKIGEVDVSRPGIQDIDIAYGSLEGKVRVINKAGYVPEVTSKETEAPTLPPTTEAVPTTTQEVTQQTDSENVSMETPKPKEESSIDVGTVIKMAVAIAVVIVFATIIYLVENRVNRKRRKRRRRRY